MLEKEGGNVYIIHTQRPFYDVCDVHIDHSVGVNQILFTPVIIPGLLLTIKFT